MTTIPTLLFAAGIFVGNWLVTPLFFKDRSRKDGFFIGIIATVLYLCIMALAGFITVG